MSYGIEQEIKYLLDKKGFQALLSFFNQSESDYKTQHNTYYDTSDNKLKRANSALRLRNWTNKSEWTFKQKQDQFRSLELNDRHTYPQLPVPKSMLLEEIQDTNIKDQLSYLINRNDQLLPFLSLKTDRWLVRINNGLLAIDRTFYSNTLDYEVELETNDLEQGLAYLHQLLHHLEIPLIPADKKIARAMNYLNSQS